MAGSSRDGGEGDVRQMERLLRVFEALGQSGPAVLWRSDGSGALTYVSARWLEATGQSTEEALGGGWAGRLHEDDGARVRDLLLTAHERREAFGVDCRLRQEDGGFRWFLLSGQPHWGAAREFEGLAGVALDIDERKRAEIALRRTQQMARFLANASVALTDMADHRNILHKVASLVVPFFADWCAIDLLREEGDLERLVVVHSQPRQAELARAIARQWLPSPSDATGPGRVACTGEPELVERVSELHLLSWTRDDEHRRVLQEVGLGSYLCVPIRWRQQTRAVLTMATSEADRAYEAADVRVAEDLAHRTSLAIDNAVLYRASLEADRRKDEFLAVLSHELRTPLNAIVGWSHVLREGTPSPEAVRKGMDTIHRNAQLQTQLIADILDISRIAAGKVRLDVRAVDLSSIVDAALDTLRPAAEARRVRLETVLDPNAGPVSGDAGRMQQVVWNLVSNAIKFVPEKTGRVHVRLEAIDSHVRLTIEDNGPGIEPGFLPHVFERFRQADASNKRPHQGLGLGLAIVRQLVELHGGTVRADNRDGHSGAIFTVELPRRSVGTALIAVESTERHPLVESPAWLDTDTSLHGLSILVVDDHEDGLDLLRTVLERSGGAVETAGSAAEALAKVPRMRPDIILTDIEMPGQSGYDLLREVRSLPPHQGGLTPVVALTAYASAQDRVQALKAGFQMHVPKPVQPAELAAVVASVAKKRSP